MGSESHNIIKHGPERTVARLPTKHGRGFGAARTVYVLDGNGVIIDTNEAVAPLTNYPANDLVGSGLSDYLDFMSRQKLEELIRDPKPADFYSFDAFIRSRDGAPLPVRLQAIALSDDAGLPIGYVVHAEPTPRSDLSALNKEDESDGYKRLLRFVSDAVLEIGPDLSITFANRAGLELFGITDDECGNGLNLTELLDQSCLRPLSMHLANALAEKHQAPTVARFMRRNGTRFEGELSISILDNGEDGKRIWAVVKNPSTYGERELSVGISESRHN